MHGLHVGLRVSDLQRSLVFYQAVGYTLIGTFQGTAHSTLSMLRLPADPFVTVELVNDPAKGNADPDPGWGSAMAVHTGPFHGVGAWIR